MADAISAGLFVLGVRMSLSKRQWIALGIFGIIMVLGAVVPQGSSLTPEQRLEITDKCIQNPDSLMCQ